MFYALLINFDDIVIFLQLNHCSLYTVTYMVYQVKIWLKKINDVKIHKI